MPELSVTDDQLRRLETVREELEAAYVGPYGTVSREEALEYLLDTYSPPAERAEDVAGQADAGNPTAGAPDERPGGDAGGGSESTPDEEATPDGTDGGGSDGATGAVGDGSPENALQQAMNLLEAYDDRWRESGGDEPYEVDLPDGSTEGVRTKDDVKRLLFKHWK